MKTLTAIGQRIKEEPVAVYGMASYGFFLLTTYGIEIGVDSQAAILGFLAYALTLYTRQKVTSVANPKTTEMVDLVPKS